MKRIFITLNDTIGVFKMKRSLFLVFAFLGLDAMQMEPAFFPAATLESEMVSPLMGRNNNNAQARQINFRNVPAIKSPVYAYVNATNEAGETALHIAAQDVQEEIYELLRKNGADETIKREDGKIPSECRPEECSICFEPLIHMLGKSNQCQHIFHKACLVSCLQRSNECPYCLTKVLTVADVESPSVGGKPITALMQAVHAGNLSEVTRLIDQAKPKQGIRAFIERVKKHPVYAVLLAATFVSVLVAEANLPPIDAETLAL